MMKGLRLFAGYVPGVAHFRENDKLPFTQAGQQPSGVFYRTGKIDASVYHQGFHIHLWELPVFFRNLVDRPRKQFFPKHLLYLVSCNIL